MPPDKAKADKAVKFIKSLKHTKGEFAGKRFNLLDWEEKIVRDLFGTVNEDGTRQYREAYISVARKNGKTEIAGAIALYCLFADGEYGAEVYCAAGDRDQASLVYGAARSMCEQEPTLYGNSKIVDSTKRIIFPKRNSVLRVISAEAYSKHGFNVSCSINDEVHVWPNRELYDVLKTGTGARSQPLIINITTAGWDRESLCYEIYNYAKQISAGIVTDPTFYSAIFELDENEDWKDERNWYKANPGLGVYRSLKEMRDSFNRACQVPAFENTFRRLYLNQWTSSETRFIQMDAWDACSASVDLDSLRSRNCYGGMDLSTTTDITALALLFEPSNGDGTFDLLTWFWIPGDNLEDRSRRDRVPYDLWVKQGLITATPGNVVDYDFIHQKIRELSDLYWIKEIGYDPWNATQIATQLQGEGYQMVPIRQGYGSLSAPSKELLKVVLQKRLRHGGNPVLRRMADSCMVVSDPAGNIKPAKDKSNGRIDGIIATIMALDRATRNLGPSVYETRGLLTIDTEEKKDEPKKPETPIDDGPKWEAVQSEPKCPRCGTVYEGEKQFCENCGLVRLPLQ